MNKLRGEALLPVYCQNTLVALILMISKGFYYFFETLKSWFLESKVFKIMQCCVLCPYFLLKTQIYNFSLYVNGIVDDTFPDTESIIIKASQCNYF